MNGDNYVDGVPYVAGSDTSKAAAEKAQKSLATRRATILKFIRDSGSVGATDNEVESEFGMRQSTVSSTRRGLAIDGLVRDSGQRRFTRSNCEATVWEYVPPAEQQALKEAIRRRRDLEKRVKAHVTALSDAKLSLLLDYLDDLARAPEPKPPKGDDEDDLVLQMFGVDVSEC